jgi:hypothetical protein
MVFLTFAVTSKRYAFRPLRVTGGEFHNPLPKDANPLWEMAPANRKWVRRRMGNWLNGKRIQ